MNRAFAYENDKPEKKRDYLGYKVFAENIKRSLDSLPSELGFSCALDGAWGIGKTTLINFLKDEIKSDEDSKYKVVDFSPWNIVDEQNLINEFFALLKKNIARSESGLKIEKYIRNYYQVIIEGVKLLPSVESFASFFNTLFSLFYRKETKTLSSVKSELCDYMKYEYTGKDLLVIIDDVDRLSGKEIMGLMKLIKEIADLPHVTYLLSLDKRNVSRAINIYSNFSEDNDYGYSYLDKFVQLWWSMPIIGDDKLKEYLWKKVKDLVGEDLFASEESYFNDICESIIFYRDDITLRKIKLLYNSFAINYAKMCSYTNFCDLLAYTWIQLFYPDLTAFIIQNRDIVLFDKVTEHNLMPNTTVTEKEKIEHENMEKNKARIELTFSKNRLDEYNQILSALFPMYYKNCLNRYASYHKRDAIMRLLFCTSENFYNYIHQTENWFISMLRRIESTLKEKNTNKIVILLDEESEKTKDFVNYLNMYYHYHRSSVPLFNLIQALFVFANKRNEPYFLIENILDYFIDSNDADSQTKYKSLQPIIETIKETDFFLIDKSLVLFLYSFIVSRNLLINFAKTEQDSILEEFAKQVKIYNFSLNNDFIYQKICLIFNHVDKNEYLNDLFKAEIKFVIAYIIVTATEMNKRSFISFKKYFFMNNPNTVFDINNFWKSKNPELASTIISLGHKVKAYTKTPDYMKMKEEDRQIIDSYCHDFNL